MSMDPSIAQGKLDTEANKDLTLLLCSGAERDAATGEWEFEIASMAAADGDQAVVALPAGATFGIGIYDAATGTTVAENIPEIVTEAATVPWPPITHAILRDGAGGGSIDAYAFPTPLEVTAGGRVRFAPGTLKMRIL